MVAPYLGRSISFEELLQARSAITKFYVKRGYITSGALIPVKDNQKIQAQGGTFIIQVIEGKIEEINVSGGSRLRKYVKTRLKKATSPLLNRDRLLEALQLLQLHPLIEKVSAQLSQGSQLGQSFLNVRIKTRQPILLEMGADNSRSPAIGRFQRGLQFTHSNLLGWGDKLGLAYRNTDGSNVYSAVYSVPINPKNGTMEFSYQNVLSNVVEAPFSRFDIIGNARAYELTFRQPLIQKINDHSTSEFAVGITASRQENKSSLLDTPYPLSRGADNNGRTRISALRFFQEWTIRRNREVFSARSQFNLGLGVFDATINSRDPDSRFFAWRGQAAWLSRIGSETSLLLKADLQISDGSLVPLEQFGLGGAGSVRGYRQDTFFTDNGFLLSAELRVPILTEETSKFYIIPFFDLGTAWNNDDVEKIGNISQQQEGTLASLGLGIEYQLENKFNARIDWGVPLIPVENFHSNSWQEKGLYFSVRYKPF